MSRLDEALAPFKESVKQQTSLPVSWDWPASGDERTAALLGEFKAIYDTVVEKYDFNVLSALMGHLSSRKDKAVWNPYFWEHWQVELTAAADAYAERGLGIDDPEERKMLFGEVTGTLAEAVELATHEPSAGFQKELVHWLDGKRDVVRREKLC